MAARFGRETVALDDNLAQRPDLAAFDTWSREAVPCRIARPDMPSDADCFPAASSIRRPKARRDRLCGLDRWTERGPPDKGGRQGFFFLSFFFLFSFFFGSVVGG